MASAAFFCHGNELATVTTATATLATATSSNNSNRQRHDINIDGVVSGSSQKLGKTLLLGKINCLPLHKDG